ncbi:MAG: ADP-forming succinate--CoA ligase subunit beta [Proteobacteria bacterium]|nr:ADP-forming succinate--CoA ligase subunit beta [Pseudomonadota bacterium]NBX86131.1 ADP-forming succinate--CoA ligase subunit beta [Pseudomonadota bacterium]
MNIHEYQAKDLFRKFGVAVPEGMLAKTGAEAEAAAKKIGTAITIVKAQVHAGGRGKAGGVKVCKSPADAKAAAEKLLGTRLVTYQTDAKGQPVNSVYVESGIDIARELYLAIMLDRSAGRLTVMASTEGGMEIEKVAHETPEKIFREQIDPALGLMPYQARNLAFALGLKGDEVTNGVKFMLNLAKAYEQLDCAMIEINPLVVTKQGQVMALDGKVSFDDNALFKHPELLELDDTTQHDPRETEARKYDLNYVGLDGEIGCMVNGAGLAMATMDIIKHSGSAPANFLDVGGGADEAKVTAALKIILGDTQVKGILINIFGGIMKCDIIANGIVAAAKAVKLHVPLVVRLEGTNVELGNDILAKSGLPIITANSLADAAHKIVKAIRK